MSGYNLRHIKAIVGLGNPGPRFDLTRHNVGFFVVDEIAKKYGENFSSRAPMLYATICVQLESYSHKILLIKPQTYMNNSGDIVPFLQKQGIKPEQVVVVHDELEKKFGSLQLRLGGSARGNNGLRSLIERWGDQFWRLRFGIDRPVEREQVADYVLSRFPPAQVAQLPEIASSVMEELGL